MTSHTLKQILEKALAEVGVDPKVACKPKGKARTTTWLAIENGFGIRHYATGRHVYVVQTRMGGRMRYTSADNRAFLVALHQALA